MVNSRRTTSYTRNWKHFANMPRPTRNFLTGAFAVATEFYGLNHNVEDLKHLNSLNSYLSIVGTESAFIKMRYWDLEQTENEKIMGQVWIPLHLEILHALWELLLEKKTYRSTIKDRVERQVRAVMYPSREMSYAPDTQEEEQVKTYLSWIKQHENAKEALQEVVQKQFNTEHELRDKIAKGRLSDPPLIPGPRNPTLGLTPERITQTAKRSYSRGQVDFRQQTSWHSTNAWRTRTGRDRPQP